MMAIKKAKKVIKQEQPIVKKEEKKGLVLKKDMSIKYREGDVMSQEDYNDYKSRGIDVEFYL